MKLNEKAKARKEINKQKEEHINEMINEIKNTKNFILVTDKYTAMAGTTQDVFKMINRMIGWLFDKIPLEAHLMYANYFEELAKEIKKNCK